jgi:hypothetical protein
MAGGPGPSPFTQSRRRALQAGLPAAAAHRRPNQPWRPGQVCPAEVPDHKSHKAASTGPQAASESKVLPNLNLAPRSTIRNATAEPTTNAAEDNDDHAPQAVGLLKEGHREATSRLRKSRRNRAGTF